MASLFAAPGLAQDAVYYLPGSPAGTACRVVLRQERQDYGSTVALVVGAVTTARVRAADLPGGRPVPRARLVVGGATYEVQANPERSTGGVWTLGLVELPS